MKLGLGTGIGGQRGRVGGVVAGGGAVDESGEGAGVEDERRAAGRGGILEVGGAAVEGDRGAGRARGINPLVAGAAVDGDIGRARVRSVFELGKPWQAAETTGIGDQRRCSGGGVAAEEHKASRRGTAERRVPAAAGSNCGAAGG